MCLVSGIEWAPHGRARGAGASGCGAVRRVSGSRKPDISAKMGVSGSMLGKKV